MVGRKASFFRLFWRATSNGIGTLTGYQITRVTGGSRSSGSSSSSSSSSSGNNNHNNCDNNYNKNIDSDGFRVFDGGVEDPLNVITTEWLRTDLKMKNDNVSTNNNDDVRESDDGGNINDMNKNITNKNNSNNGNNKNNDHLFHSRDEIQFLKNKLKYGKKDETAHDLEEAKEAKEAKEGKDENDIFNRLANTGTIVRPTRAMQVLHPS